MNDELPCLDLLEATPAILRELMSEISGEDARWKPARARLLDRRGAGASVAFRRSLLSRAGGSIFVRGDAGVRTGRCADAPGDLLPRRPSAVIL